MESKCIWYFAHAQDDLNLHILYMLEGTFSLEILTPSLLPSRWDTWNPKSIPRKIQGPVVKSIVSLTSWLRVISLTVLADSIYNIMIFLKATQIFSGQEAAGSTPAEVGNILSWRLIMKYFLRSFSPFRWFKKGNCQFLAKECCTILVNRLED